MEIGEAVGNIVRLIGNISSSPELDSQLIVAAAIGRDRSFILAHPEYVVSAKEATVISQYIKKRLSGQPMAYITGQKEFMGLDFLVNGHVLVPRPETETMVELAIKSIDEKKQEALIIDIGTGSGAIIISLAKMIASQGERRCFVASDISRRALKTARKNADINKVKVDFYRRNLLRFFPWKKYSRYRNLLICANLPYIGQEEYRNFPSIKCEPKKALISGRDGLSHYRRLAKQIKAIASRFSTIEAYFEINPWQAEGMKQIFPEGGSILDLSGQVRFWKIERKNDQI